MQRRSERGYSLMELLIVIGLLALVAAIAVPALSRPDEAVLDRAATEVAAALRFAQAEAQRTGEAHGVIADVNTATLRVYRLDETVNPPVFVYDVYDPFKKQLYTLSLADVDGDLQIAGASFIFSDSGTARDFVDFSGETGVPRYNNAGTLYLLESGVYTVELQDLSRNVSVAPVTGRVTVQ